MNFDKSKMLTPLKGQEEIFQLIGDRNHIKLWKKVQYVGYREVKKPSMRKICFMSAYNEFDPTINNNFITFYLTRLHYMAINDYNMRERGLTGDKRAIAQYSKDYWWPSVDDKPVNQNANILQHFHM